MADSQSINEYVHDKLIVQRARGFLLKHGVIEPRQKIDPNLAVRMASDLHDFVFSIKAYLCGDAPAPPDNATLRETTWRLMQEVARLQVALECSGVVPGETCTGCEFHSGRADKAEAANVELRDRLMDLEAERADLDDRVCELTAEVCDLKASMPR